MTMEQDDLTKLLRRGWWAARGSLLFILPLPLLIALFVALATGDLTKVLTDLGAFALFLTGALLTRKGFAQQALWEEHGLQSRAAFPFKTAGAACVALATALTALLSVGHDVLFSLVLAALSLLGFYLAYGFDIAPITASGDQGVNQQDLHDTLREAIVKIDDIEAASRSLANEELKQRLKRIAALARQVLKLIEQSPKDVHRARKFLYVYLDGARSVCEGYAKTHARANSLQLEDNFRNVLMTIEDVFVQQQQRLLAKEVMDLDIQIEVLNTQMKREGIL